MTNQKSNVFWLGLVTLISYFTYFHNYGNPPNFFWDENYHVASAEKYLHGTFFMEQHPPLGKLLIALGEKWLHPNPRTDHYLGTMHADSQLPATLVSFKGFRFFPALLGWLSAPLFYLIFLSLGAGGALAFLLSGLYVFDNALIVHSRGAMLEPPLLFFSLSMIQLYVWLIRWRDREHLFLWGSAACGALFGLVMTTKILGLIMGGLVPALMIKLWPDWKKILRMSLAFWAAFAVVWVAVWQIHDMLAWRVNPDLPADGYFTALPEYRKMLAAGEGRSLRAWPTMMRNWIRFVPIYNSGTDRLDLSRPGENASPFFYWPFGARAIDYLRFSPAESNEWHRYLFLQSNPLGWFCGLVGIFLGFAFWLVPLMFKVETKPKHWDLIGLFLFLYVSYMAIIAQLDREMYLYHYFMPLLFSYLLFGLVVLDLEWIGQVRVSQEMREEGMFVVTCGLLGVFLFFSPLTYYRPMSNREFRRRQLLRIWNLRYPGDPMRDPVAQAIPRPGFSGSDPRNLSVSGRTVTTVQRDSRREKAPVRVAAGPTTPSKIPAWHEQ